MELFFHIPKEIKKRTSGKQVLSWIAKHPELQARSARYADYIVPVGGDGTMLSAIHKYWKLDKPFFGIHAGRRGFLMNHATSFTDFKQGFESPQRIESTLLIASLYNEKWQETRSDGI